MSGTLAALTAQQLVTTGFQAWTPWTPPPDTPGPPNFLYGTLPQLAINAPAWLGIVLTSWAQPDPLPTLPIKHPVGQGAALALQGNPSIVWLETVQTAWIPPDPLPTLPALLRRVTKSGPPAPPAPTPASKAVPPQHVSSFGATPMYTVPGVGASALVGGIVPAAGTASVIVQGGTAIAAVIGPVNGGYITNPLSATAQAITTAENCYIDMVNQPGATDSTANGTTVLLAPGQTFTIPAIATGVIIWANAATSGHSLTIVTW